MDVSISEVQDFLRCRRKWGLTSKAKSEGLEPIGVPHIALYVGTIIHEGLSLHIDDWVSGNAESHDRSRYMEFLESAENEVRAKYTEAVGTGLSASEEEELAESRELSLNLLTRYFQHYGLTSTYGKDIVPIGSEISFRVRVPGTKHRLIGTFDGLLYNPNTNEVLVLEHKTYNRTPRLDNLMFTPQFSAYCWAASMIFGSHARVRGVLYNGLSKSEPKTPRLLSNGTLSKAKILTDYGTYLKAIEDNNLDPNDYTDVLNQLKVGESPFYFREILETSLPRLESFERRLKQILDDMSREPINLYPNFRWDGCWDCGVSKICHAIEYGDNVNNVIYSFFQKTGERSTIRNQKDPSLSGKELLKRIIEKSDMNDSSSENA